MNENCKSVKVDTQSPEKSPEVKITSALETFKYQNDYAEDVISSIKSRLNNIYIFSEKDPGEKIPELIVNCALDEFNWQLVRQYKNNKALSDILLHLKEII